MLFLAISLPLDMFKPLNHPLSSHINIDQWKDHRNVRKIVSEKSNTPSKMFCDIMI
jgi:hypothetical protein